MTEPRRGYLPTPGGEALSVEMVEASALDAANARIATLRERYAEAVRALNKNEAGWCVCCGSHPDEAHASECAVHAVLSRPEAQEVLRG